MTKRNRILCLCLAILATAAVAFFLLYPHTTGPVLPRSGDAHIQAVELRADGELRVWSPKTEEDREKELVFSHKTVFDGPISPSEELAGGRFWPLDEIRQNLGKNVFTPNFEREFTTVLNQQ